MRTFLSDEPGDVRPLGRGKVGVDVSRPIEGIPTDVICGKIKILSSSGGNVSLRPFVYFVGDETAYYDSGMPDADLDALIVKNFCAD